MKLDLNLLPVLVAIVEEGGGSAADRRLKMSQPAVSAALGRLRDSFDDPFFVRTARGLDPTPRALAALAPIRTALALVCNDVMQGIKFDPATSTRTITLALWDIGETVFLRKILERFGQEAPNVSVQSVTLPPDQTARVSKLGEIDLALGYFPDLKGNNFYQQRLFSHGFVCPLRSGHPIKGSRLTARQFVQLVFCRVNTLHNFSVDLSH